MPHMVATNIASATSAALNIVSATTANYTNIAPKWSRQKNVTRDLEPANSEASYFSAPEIISLTVTVVQIHVQFSKFLSLCLSQGWTLRWKRLHWESLPWWSPIRWIYIYILDHCILDYFHDDPYDHIADAFDDDADDHWHEGEAWCPYNWPSRTPGRPASTWSLSSSPALSSSESSSSSTPPLTSLPASSSLSPSSSSYMKRHWWN